MQDSWEKLVAVVVATLGINREQITPEAHFLKDLGADSLLIFDLVTAFEDEFDLLIPDGDIAEIQTVRQAHEYLRRRLLESVA